MNFYSMNVNEIERYMRNNFIGINDITQSLIDQLKDVSYKYEQLTEVLDSYCYSTDPQLLDDEIDISEDYLKELKEEVENLLTENDTLQDKLNVLKETLQT